MAIDETALETKVFWDSRFRETRFELRLTFNARNSNHLNILESDINLSLSKIALMNVEESNED
jgi:hypothetical protein